MPNPAAFDAADTEAEAEAFAQWVKASPRLAGHDEIYMPGEIECLRRTERSENGIPIDTTSWKQITDTALAVGLDADDFAAVRVS